MLGGILTGILTATLYVLAGGAIVSGAYLKNCQHNVALQKTYEARYEATCESNQKKASDYQAKVDDLKKQLTDTTLSARQLSTLNYVIKSRQRSATLYQNQADRYCKKAAQASDAADALTQKCTVVATATPTPRPTVRPRPTATPRPTVTPRPTATPLSK